MRCSQASNKMKFDLLRTTNDRTTDWFDIGIVSSGTIDKRTSLDRLRCAIPLWQRTRTTLSWLLEVCIETDGWSNEVDVRLDVNRNAIFITGNVRLLRL